MGLRIALYHNLPIGGASRTVSETVRRLAEAHHVDLFRPSTATSSSVDFAPYVNEVIEFPFEPSSLLRSPFGRLNNALRLLDLWRIEALGRRAARAIDGRGYDAVLVHPCALSQSPAVLRYLGTPSVYYCHEPLRVLYEPSIPRPGRRRSLFWRAINQVDPLNAAYRTALRLGDRRSALAATRVLTNSLFTHQNLRSIYGIDSKVSRPGVDTTSFKPLSVPRLGRVLSVGALKPEKGFDFVIKALATIPDDIRPELMVVSNVEEQGERPYLQQLAHEMGVRVDFRVGVANDELIRLYNSALVTVYAPVREPLGLVPLESQACETPVVGVSEGGVRETIVNRRTGLLVSRDPAMFGAAVSSLVGDTALRVQYGKAGRLHVEQEWSWESSVADLEEVLLEASQLERRGVAGLGPVVRDARETSRA